MALTWRAGALAALGAVFVGLVLPSWIGIAVVVAVIAVGVAVDVVLAGPVRTLTFARSGDTTVRLGATARVRLVVTNPSARPVRALIRDAWPPSAGLRGTAGSPPANRLADPTIVQPRHAVTIPAGERRRIESVLVPTRRGDRQAEHVSVRSFGPLGLAARQRTMQSPWRVRVLPPFLSRRHLPSRLARLRELDGRTSLLVRGQGTEFDSLRDYTIGDDIRSIDWRATARRHIGDHYDVVVRTWRPERDRSILIVLDTSRTAAGRIGTEDLGTDGVRLDAALDAALLLTALALRAGDRVDLLAYDRRIRTAVTRAPASQTLAQVTDAMATLEPELVELDARGLVTTVLNRAPQRSLVVLLTSLDSAPMAEGLLPVINRLTTRHEVVVASVADPRIEQMAQGRTTATAIYEAASAERARAERRHVADLLAKHRVRVVDQPPALIAPALADAYLALKAAGRL
ncbi:DUF58 domain-containing protein [Catenulispora sp. NL8]|uniref:DUF58 domain-containing protein n=1 Tax=Catenulispora pinistramenti TaxID=2705254 RepID=A0ABS5L093_9ACTN|nr:DUF58 domain-containing protein [Catenulispora pinistramenti]MBS2551751.1 DUF58 domain-containing protein [Catenulispora pinistramenti]